MSKRDEFVAQMHAKLDEWNTEVDRLQRMARKQKAQDTADDHAIPAELQGTREEPGKKRHEVQNASEDALETLLAGTERIWDDVKRTLQETRRSFLK